MISEHETLLILDFGSQYTQLIARRIREANVYCRVISHKTPAEEIQKTGAKALIFTGGPASVYAEGAPRVDEKVFDIGIPILGICYGLQLTAHELKGKVTAADRREYGHTMLKIKDHSDLFAGVPDEIRVWMSHGDRLEKLPPGFDVLASSDATKFAGVRSKKRKFYGVQFHPEVAHTQYGKEIFHNFLYKIAGFSGDWQVGSFIEEQVAAVKHAVGNAGVVCGLSGGVDSAVTSLIVHKAVGARLTCIFVDNGLLRLNEASQVVETFKGKFGLKLIHVDAVKRFLDALKGVEDPEEKRKIIGREFIRVFEDAAKGIKDAKFLAQGTLYPDVIESVAAHGGPTQTIKSHHNVGGLPKDLGFELVEPLRWLFKDEVRKVAKALGLPDAIVWRQPFPGPGLAVRILGEVTETRLELLRKADDVIVGEIKKAGLYKEIWQAFGVLLPVRSVGVMGDERTYESALVVRAVSSEDGMTADWVRLPYEVLNTIANRITSEVRGINRVVYDVSSKPPSTIEWE